MFRINLKRFAHFETISKSTMADAQITTSVLLLFKLDTGNTVCQALPTNDKLKKKNNQDCCIMVLGANRSAPGHRFFKEIFHILRHHQPEKETVHIRTQDRNVMERDDVISQNNVVLICTAAPQCNAATWLPHRRGQRSGLQRVHTTTHAGL